MQAELREAAVQLYPRNLNVVDGAGEQQARQRVNFEMLGQRWAGARQSLMEEQRVLVDEAEGNEFGEASGLGLNLAQQPHLANPVRGSFGVSVHQRRSGANAAAVRGADDFDPLRGRKFVGREDVANLVVENFGGGAGQRAQAVVAQHGKIVGQRHAGEFDAVDDFHRREGVDVHARDGVLDGAENVAVVELGKIVRQAALDADFGRAELPGLDGLLRHLVEREEVGVGLARAAAEGAELASHETDVGEIDVAVDHVGDEVAGEFGAQQVGGDQQAEEIVAFGIGQRVGLFQRQVGAVLRFENFLERSAQRGSQARRDVRPVERGKGFEFGVSKFAGHDFSVGQCSRSSRSHKSDVILKPSAAGLRDRTTDEMRGTPIAYV